MCHYLDVQPDQLTRAYVGPPLSINFFGALLKAGFPSPAESYIEQVCDLNELCITNAEATYFVRIQGDSMNGDKIDPGDILIVDCSLEPVAGRIVVAWLNGSFTLKRIRYAKPLIVLEPSNEKYTPTYVQPEDDFRVFGVAVFNITKLL